MPISSVSSDNYAFQQAQAQQLQVTQQAQQAQQAQTASTDKDNDRGSEAAEGRGTIIDVKG